MNYRIAIPLSILLMTTTELALASGDAECPAAPKSEWMSEQDLTTKVVDMGYDVRRVKTEDNCYEVYAITPDGKKVELFFNPVSAELVKTKSED